MSDELDEISPEALAQKVFETLVQPAEDVAPVVEEEPAAETEDATDRPRDEKGRFVSVEKEDGEVEEGQGAPEETEEQEEEILLAGKFRSPEELERAYQELDSFRGRQASELGELRSQVEQLSSLIQAQMAAPPPLPHDFGDILEEDPARATKLAYEAGDFESLVTAVEAWGEQDPFQAAVFWTNLQNEFAAAQQEDGPADQAGDHQSAEALDAEVAKVVERHPDLEKYLPAIGEAARGRPDLRSALEDGTPRERALALEQLYLLARGRDTDTHVQRAQQRAQQEADAAAQQARDDAVVVTGSRGTSSGKELTGEEAFRSAFAERLGLQIAD